MRPKVDMNSPEIAANETVKTLAGSGKACQKESENTGCISGLTPNINAKSGGVFTLPRASVNVLRGKTTGDYRRREVRLELKAGGILRGEGGRGGGCCGGGRHVLRGDYRELRESRASGVPGDRWRRGRHLASGSGGRHRARQAADWRRPNRSRGDVHASGWRGDGLRGRSRRFRRAEDLAMALAISGIKRLGRILV